MCLSFPAPSLFFLAWGAVAPFLAFIWWAGNRRTLLLGHFLMSTIYFGGVLLWIPRVLIDFGGLGAAVSLFALLVMVLVLGAFLLPFTLASYYASRLGKETFLLSAPAAWMLTELARNYLAVNGFPWAALGYSQFHFPLLTQVADLGGVYLVSGLVIVINIVILAVYWGERRIYIGGGLVILFALFYGSYRLWIWTPEVTGNVKSGLVQGNIALQESREYYADKYFKTLPRLAEKAWAENADWVILPEAQCPFYFERDFYFRTFWERKAGQNNCHILLNSTRMDRDTVGKYYNSAYLLEPGRGAAFVYDKIHLVPFGEYLPLASLLTFADTLVSEVSSYTPGEDIRIGTLSGEKPFGTLICYEDVFPELSRRNAAAGAEILVNITNDLWYGDTAAPAQHLQIASFRCIETRRALLRAANSGFTAIIDPRGRVLQQTELFTEDCLLGEVPLVSNTTLFTCLGEIPVILLILASAAWPLYSRHRRKKPGEGDDAPD